MTTRAFVQTFFSGNTPNYSVIGRSKKKVITQDTTSLLEKFTVKQLYKLAQEHNVPNRSKMRKGVLINSLKPFYPTVESIEAIAI